MPAYDLAPVVLPAGPAEARVGRQAQGSCARDQVGRPLRSGVDHCSAAPPKARTDVQELSCMPAGLALPGRAGFAVQPECTALQALLPPPAARPRLTLTWPATLQRRGAGGDAAATEPLLGPRPAPGAARVPHAGGECTALLAKSVPPCWQRVYRLAGGEPACHPALARAGACLLGCFCVVRRSSIKGCRQSRTRPHRHAKGRQSCALRYGALPSPAFSHFVKPQPACPLLQAVSHYGEALKAIVNEKFGDGIMSGVGLLFILFSLHFSLHLMQPPKRCAARDFSPAGANLCTCLLPPDSPLHRAEFYHVCRG